MLSALLKTITRSELEYIAALDYGQDTETHLAALHAVIFDQDGELRDGQHWYPYEVIELGSHVLETGHEREFFLCTMLVLQSVLNGYDRSIEPSEKLADRTREYDRLPVELRDEILRGYQLVGV